MNAPFWPFLPVFSWPPPGAVRVEPRPVFLWVRDVRGHIGICRQIGNTCPSCNFCKAKFCKQDCSCLNPHHLWPLKNDSNLDQNWAKIELKIDLKVVQKWTKMDQKWTQNGPETGLRLDQNVLLLGHFRASFRLLFKHSKYILGVLLAITFIVLLFCCLEKIYSFNKKKVSAVCL